MTSAFLYCGKPHRRLAATIKHILHRHGYTTTTHPAQLSRAQVAVLVVDRAALANSRLRKLASTIQPHRLVWLATDPDTASLTLPGTCIDASSDTHLALRQLVQRLSLEERSPRTSPSVPRIAATLALFVLLVFIAAWSIHQRLLPAAPVPTLARIALLEIQETPTNTAEAITEEATGLHSSAATLEDIQAAQEIEAEITEEEEGRERERLSAATTTASEIPTGQANSVAGEFVDENEYADEAGRAAQAANPNPAAHLNSSYVEERFAANFSASPTTGTAPLTVQFTNQSIGQLMAYRWDFDGDGTIDSTQAQPPPFTYTQPGHYDAYLEVVGANEDSDYNFVRIEVLNASGEVVSSPVQAAFSVNPVMGPAPLQVTVSNASQANITSYAWDFDNDGTIDSSSPQPAPFIYQQPGLYTLSLRVTGASGQEHIARANVRVTSTTTSAPASLAAHFNATPLTGTTPLRVMFTSLATGAIASYAWDFNGDGVTDSTQPHPTYTYTQAGTYAVRFTVTGMNGASASSTTTVVASVPAAGVYADFFATPLSGPAPLTVSLLNFAFGDIVAYAWDFNGDGIIDSTQPSPPPFTYHTAGTYSLSLTVTSSSGQQVTESLTITVTGQTTPEPTEPPATEVTQEPTGEVTEPPVTEATQEATAEVTEPPAIETTQEATIDVTGPATAEVTQEPTDEPAPEVTEPAATEATESPTAVTENPSEEATQEATGEGTEEASNP